MVAQRDKVHRMTLDEYRELERTSHDAKYEYIDGQVWAMSGGSRAHGRIGSNVVRLLEDALDDIPCHTYNSDVRVRLSATRYTYPNASVSCDPGDDETTEGLEVQSPHLIVEVLSDSTEAYDRGRKFMRYQACASMQEYVLIGTDYQAVEVFRRTSEGWTAYHLYRPGDAIELMGASVRIPVSALYRRTNVPIEVDGPDGEV
jgi:Uma2 family endonuclease